MDFTQKLANIYSALHETPFFMRKAHGNITLFLSVSDGDKRASIAHASGHSLEDVWQNVLAEFSAAMKREKPEGKWIRVDWVENIEPTTWRSLREKFATTKRNYFRYGLALDPELNIAFLEQELNGNAMLYGGNAFEHAVVNENNFTIYAKRRFGGAYTPDFSDEKPVFVFSTGGIFCDEDGLIHTLDGKGLDTGRRQIRQLEADDLFSLIDSGSSYLSRQVKPDGRFIYGYHPCFDREIPAYNALRHASSLYSMIEAWEVTQSSGLLQAIDKALSYLTRVLIRPVRLNDGTMAAFLVEANDEIKLGGNAVCLLALVKYSEVRGTRQYLPLLEQLALGILHMQSRQTGKFSHVLSYPSLAVKEEFRIIYYDGEAAFGLMRLYGLTKDPRWLEAVERAFEYFIAAEHWNCHDHWLAYCVNELTLYRPEERYYRFGIQNFATYLDFVLNRITTFPTLLELMTAAEQMIARLRQDDRHNHLLGAIDLEKFYRALHARAHHLLNGHFWPEYAMYFANPARITGSFFIRHHAFRVRIDDVEHYLSGFAAYRKYLLSGHREAEEVSAPRASVMGMEHPKGNNSGEPFWSAAGIAEATAGEWLVTPPDGWSASGLCIYAPSFRPGDMVVLRLEGDQRGMLPRIMQNLPERPSALIVSQMNEFVADTGIPVLKVADTGKAVLAIGAYARTGLSGKIIGITGSAGKTTSVAMLSHVLEAWGPTEHSAHNANLPHGVAWNLASFNPSTSHIVMELAIGRMGISARMARPHIGIVTNILPAHLGESSTIGDIARTKAAMFTGMQPGDTAILNRDMHEWETVHDIAKARGLNIIHYGTHEESAFRLLSYRQDERLVHARIPGRDLYYHLGAAGIHMAMNSLAVLAAVSALGYEPEPALAGLASFAALPGRGEEMKLDFRNRHINIVDDAYNANPGSMHAALARLGSNPGNGRRIAILGEMAELGPKEEAYHTGLAEIINACPIDQVFVVGRLYDRFWDALSPEKRGARLEHRDEIKNLLEVNLTDGDIVLFKGSHSTGIHEIVEWLKRESILRMPAREAVSA